MTGSGGREQGRLPLRVCNKYKPAVLQDMNGAVDNVAGRALIALATYDRERCCSPTWALMTC